MCSIAWILEIMKTGNPICTETFYLRTWYLALMPVMILMRAVSFVEKTWCMFENGLTLLLPDSKDVFQFILNFCKKDKKHANACVFLKAFV